MPERTIDELLDAIETVRILRDTIAKHESLLERMAERLERLERAVTALTPTARRRKP